MTQKQRDRPRKAGPTSTSATPAASVISVSEGITAGGIPGWGSDLPSGRAYAGPPSPGRELWLVAVLSCPRCGAMHHHRLVEAARLLSGRAVRRCPTTGRPYRLAPVQRRREARRVVRRG